MSMSKIYRRWGLASSFHFTCAIMSFFCFWIRGNLIFWKTYFVGPNERVKPRLFQALTRGARPDSNSRPAVQISSTLPSRYTPWGPLCHYASEQFISNWILFQRCDLKALLTSSISSVKTLLSNWKVFMSFSLLSIYSNLLSWHIQQDTDVFMIACANLLFYNKVIDGTIIKWIASQFIYQFGVTYTHHISWIK